MPRTSPDDLEVTTLGTHTLIRAIPPSEHAAVTDYWDAPPIMVKDGNTIVNDDAGTPIQFRDVTTALRWLRTEPSDRRTPSSSD